MQGLLRCLLFGVAFGLGPGVSGWVLDGFLFLIIDALLRCLIVDALLG